MIRVDADRSQNIVYEENDPEQVEHIEWLLQSEGLKREHMDSVTAEVAQSISSIAFGGADRKTVYLGNLLDDRIYTFQSPVPGVAPPHWGMILKD